MSLIKSVVINKGVMQWNSSIDFQSFKTVQIQKNYDLNQINSESNSILRYVFFSPIIFW